MLDNLFPFGEYPVRIEVAYDGNRYSVQQRGTHLADHVQEIKLINEEFHFHGKNHGKLPEGSEISWKEGKLTINGKLPAEPKE